MAQEECRDVKKMLKAMQNLKLEEFKTLIESGGDIENIRERKRNIEQVFNTSSFLRLKLKRWEKVAKKTQRIQEIKKKINGDRITKDTPINDLHIIYNNIWGVTGFKEGEGPFSLDTTYRNFPIDIHNFKEDISRLTGFTEDQISSYTETKNKNFLENTILKGKIKYHYGNLSPERIDEDKEITCPEIVNGDLQLQVTSAKTLTLPKIIHGDLLLLYLLSTEKLVLPETVNGSLRMPSLTEINGLEFPKTIHGKLTLNGLDSAHNIVFPQDGVNGLISLDKLRTAHNVQFPKTLIGSIYLFSLEKATNMTLPETIIGSIATWELKSAKGVTFPKTIDGDLILLGLTTTDGLVLPDIVTGKVLVDRNKFSEEDLVTMEQKYSHLNIEYKE